MRGTLSVLLMLFTAVALMACSSDSKNAASPGVPNAELPVLPVLPVLPENDASKNLMGMNTWFLKDWDDAYAFVDAMKHARPWQDAANWHNPVAGVDALGWPTADASTVIITGPPEKVNGTYKLVFTGQADVTLMWASGSVTNKIYDAASNVTTADVTYNIPKEQSVGLVFKNSRRTAASAINTGFTDVRLYRPGYPTDGSVVFTADYTAALKKTSVIRLMDWTATNNNFTQHWADRITPLHFYKKTPTYTGPGGGVWSNSDSGVALEHQIQLCNQVQADCWINIPVAASDDFIRNVALALRYGTDGTNPYTIPQTNPVYPPLAPGLRLYVEYANEIWNTASGFYGFHVIRDIVSSLPADHPLKKLAPTTAGEYQWLFIYPAYRIAGISDIFRSVYGDVSMMNRVRPVLMTQQGNANATLSLALNWLDAYAKSKSPARAVNSYVYGAGGSAYYSSDATIAEADRGNADLYFGAGAYPSTQSARKMGLDAIWAGNFGLKRIAYEGGPSLDYYTQVQADAINLDPRMQDMIAKTHDAWSAAGGDLLMYYVTVGPHEWRFTPDIATTASSPKYQGIVQLNSQPRAAVTLGQQLPGTIVATDWWTNYKVRTGYDYFATKDSLLCIAGNDEGEWIALPGRASSAYTGILTVHGVSSTGATINVWVNGVNQGQVTLPKGSTLIDSSALEVKVPAGLVVIRLEMVSGGMTLYSVKVPSKL